MLLNGKSVDLVKLGQELTVAGIPHNALGTAGDDLFTYDAKGSPVELPPEAQAVIEAHISPTPALTGLTLIPDKLQITADGIDTATCTITLQPVSAGFKSILVLIDGPVITKCPVVDDTAEFLFRATDPGIYTVLAVAGEVEKRIFVEAV